MLFLRMNISMITSFRIKLIQGKNVTLQISFTVQAFQKGTRRIVVGKFNT